MALATVSFVNWDDPLELSRKLKRYLSQSSPPISITPTEAVLAVEQGRANCLSVSSAFILGWEFVPSDKLRVLIADDDIRTRHVIVRLLRDEFEVIGDVGSGRELVQAALARNPDVIVSDVAMPLLGGVEAIRELSAAGKAIPFVLISSVFYRAGVGHHTGAVAYVDKSDLQFDLVSAVRSAMLGQPFHSRSIRR